MSKTRLKLNTSELGMRNSILKDRASFQKHKLVCSSFAFARRMVLEHCPLPEERKHQRGSLQQDLHSAADTNGVAKKVKHNIVGRFATSLVVWLGTLSPHRFMMLWQNGF